jgi:ribonuclease G
MSCQNWNIYIKVNTIYKEAILSDVVNFAKEIEALDKSIYVEFVNNLEYFKVEPLIFASQITNLANFKIYV